MLSFILVNLFHCLFCLILGSSNCSGFFLDDICHELVKSNDNALVNTYEAASEYCQQRGGYLVSIVNDQYQATLSLYLRDNKDVEEVWLGARHRSSLWKWVNGE